jgi:hypothetical protein
VELGNAVPEKPILFMKPASSYITEGSPIKVLPNSEYETDSNKRLNLNYVQHILIFYKLRFLEVALPFTMKLSLGS